MKKKIAILGSTGSIGKSLIEIINQNKNLYKIILLTANRDHLGLFKQAKKFGVKNLIITNKNSFEILKKKTKNLNINVFNNFENLNQILKNKIDYVMSSITGLDGLKPTIKIIKYCKIIAIANKEAIICGWNLIKKELTTYKTTFVPVDSEHFSIWYGLLNNKHIIKKIYITASGGPFINLPKKQFKNIKVRHALKHPSWKMGKKITIDSATMMNKVFEIIEAKKIFNLNYKQLTILTHPFSYVHALIHFENGLTKIIAHNTDMKIPIGNSLSYKNEFKYKSSSDLELYKLNNLNFKKINLSKFPSVNLIKLLPNKFSFFETILVTANDELVRLFLNKKIRFDQIYTNLIKILKKREFNKYKKKIPSKIEDILKLSDYVRFKIISKSI